MPKLTDDPSRNVAQVDIGMRFMMDCLHVGFWNFDVASNMFRVTKTWLKIRGLSDRSVVDVSNDDWSQSIHPEDRRELLEVFNAQKSGDMTVVDIQFRHKHPERHWVWIQCRASIVARDAKGMPTRIVGIDTEVSSLKENEEESTRIAEKLKLAVEVSGLGIFEFDPRKMQTTWDDRMLEIYGVEDGIRVRPNTFWETFLHPDDRDNLVALTEESERLGLPVTCDYRIVRSDGEVRYIRALSRRVSTAGSGDRLVGINLDITDDMTRTQELEEARRLLRYDALHDALTGLGNRRFFDETLAAHVGRIDAHQPYIILALDLDKFKSLNDKLGHAAGDHALKRAAEIIERALPVGGQAFRVGGDEFMVLLKVDLDDVAVSTVCDEIITQLSQPFPYGTHICQIGCSIGFARGYDRGRPIEDIVSNADTALYAAKRAGRSCFIKYENVDKNALNKRGKSDRELHEAVERGEFTCVYQPQFDARTGELIGAEALVRWQTENGVTVPPQEFLAQAAMAGCLADIDRAVFMQVIDQQSNWHAKGQQVVPISINVSDVRLKDQDFCRDIATLVKPHHALSFELLETANYDRLDDEVLFRLDTIREAAIAIELDDFGTGHSSILAMQSIMPDRIKIDRSLVAAAMKDARGMQALEALIKIGRSYGAQVLLEGIETRKMVEQLSMLDCDAFQGFWLSPPLTPPDFQRLFGTREASSA